MADIDLDEVVEKIEQLHKADPGEWADWQLGHEYPANISIHFLRADREEYDRSLWWGMANDTWGADVLIVDPNQQVFSRSQWEPAGYNDYIQCIATNMPCSETDVDKVATAIFEETNHFLRMCDDLDSADIDNLEDEMFNELLVAYEIQADHHVALDNAFKKVVEAFPAIKTGDFAPDITVAYLDAYDRAKEALDHLRVTTSKALTAWLNSNIHSRP